MQQSCSAAFPTRTKSPTKACVRKLVRKHGSLHTTRNNHSKTMGGKSGHPVTVLTPAKLAEVDAAIRADFGKRVNDHTINTNLKNNFGLAQKSMSRACRKLDFHS